jgi:hypothetical protein
MRLWAIVGMATALIIGTGQGTYAQLQHSAALASARFFSGEFSHSLMKHNVKIFGNDDRVCGPIDTYAGRHPYNAVGLMIGAWGGFCTATLVAPRLVLTAAHCAQKYEFSGEVRTGPIYFPGVTRMFQMSKVVFLGTDDPRKKTSNNDVILFELDDDISGVEPLAVAKLDPYSIVRAFESDSRRPVRAGEYFLPQYVNRSGNFSLLSSYEYCVHTYDGSRQSCMAQEKIGSLNLLGSSCDAVGNASGSPAIAGLLNPGAKTRFQITSMYIVKSGHDNDNAPHYRNADANVHLTFAYLGDRFFDIIRSYQPQNTHVPSQQANAPPTSSVPTTPAFTLRDAQERLRTLGFYRGSIDGQMGPQTKAAIEAFQRTNNLRVTGELTASTIDALRR